MKAWWSGVLICSVLIFAQATPAQAVEVNIYSERKEELIKPLLDQFSKETGFEVNLVTEKVI
jgi:hypothetical protein